jgi:hypothetical protein
MATRAWSSAAPHAQDLALPQKQRLVNKERLNRPTVGDLAQQLPLRRLLLRWCVGRMWRQ